MFSVFEAEALNNIWKWEITSTVLSKFHHILADGTGVFFCLFQILVVWLLYYLWYDKANGYAK